MKVFLSYLLWTVFCSLNLHNGIDCTSFRNGKFKLVDKEIEQEYLIERNESIQIEMDLKNNTISKFRVTWVTDCEYELDILEGRKEVMDFFTGKTLSIRIVETFDKGYKYEAQLKGTEMKVIHTVERVN